VLIDKNWNHDTTVKAFRFDRVNSASATWGTNGTITNNVAWRSGEMAIKGDKHTVSNNLVFDANQFGDAADGKPGPAIFVMMYDPSKSWSIKGENSHTKMHCNGADWIFNVSNTLPGDGQLKTSNNSGGVNLKGGVRPQLANPDELDFRYCPLPTCAVLHALSRRVASADCLLTLFLAVVSSDCRPKAGGLFDTANIGPYHSTDANGSSYWIPGEGGGLQLCMK
jgi:hypothetical protein